MKEFTVEQTKKAYCHEATTQVGARLSEFHVNYDGLLIVTSKIECCLQRVVPVSFKERILHTEHHRPIAGHPGERITGRMFAHHSEAPW